VAGPEGLATVDAPAPTDDPPAAAPAPALAAPEIGGDERTTPTQRRLAPRATGDDVAAPAPATASARTSGDGPFRREVLPLLLLGGAVCMAYVASLQVAERRRSRRGAGR